MSPRGVGRLGMKRPNPADQRETGRQRIRPFPRPHDEPHLLALTEPGRVADDREDRVVPSDLPPGSIVFRPSLHVKIVRKSPFLRVILQNKQNRGRGKRIFTMIRVTEELMWVNHLCRCRSGPLRQIKHDGWFGKKLPSSQADFRIVGLVGHPVENCVGTIHPRDRNLARPAAPFSTFPRRRADDVPPRLEEPLDPTRQSDPNRGCTGGGAESCLRAGGRIPP